MLKMKHKIIIYAIVLLFYGHYGFTQKHFEEVIKKELKFTDAPSKSTLVITNIFGPVTVEAHSGDAILIEVKREIFADTDETLMLGKQELELGIIKEQDRIILRPKSPYFKFHEEGFKFNCCNDNREPPYQHKLSFKVKVPTKANLNVSTVNEGDISIKNTSGKSLKVNNINGAIALTNVEGKTKVHCINGDVDITYATNPVEASEYYSLNGDINVRFRKVLSAAISFKSFNGELFTDFDISKQYTDTKKTANEGRAKFKYEAFPVMQIGAGDTDFKFETFNGNVFVKKI